MAFVFVFVLVCVCVKYLLKHLLLLQPRTDIGLDSSSPLETPLSPRPASTGLVPVYVVVTWTSATMKAILPHTHTH